MSNLEIEGEKDLEERASSFSSTFASSAWMSASFCATCLCVCVCVSLCVCVYPLGPPVVDSEKDHFLIF